MSVVSRDELYSAQDAAKFKTVCLCCSCTPCNLTMNGDTTLAKLDNFCACKQAQWCLWQQTAAKCQCTEAANDCFCCKDAPGNPCFQGKWITCCDTIQQQCCIIQGAAFPPTEQQPLGCGLCGFMLWDPKSKWANK